MKLIVIGRNPEEANIVVNSQYISNYHAEIIQLDNGDMFLVDKSTNGTFLNGIKLAPGKEVAVRRGDNIMFADVPLDWGLIEEVRVPKDVKRLIGIGSHYMNTICVQGNNVSRFHATIRQMSNGKWYICDHSKNGTTVNGTRLTKNRYVQLKKNDEIACAGVPVQNPIPSSSFGKFPWKWVGVGTVAAVCIFALVLWLLPTEKIKKMSPESISKEYSPTVAWVVTTYHFEATASGIDLAKYGIETKYTISADGDLVPLKESDHMMSAGTGFFIGPDGHLVSNRHVARPWEYSDRNLCPTTSLLEYAEASFRRKLVHSPSKIMTNYNYGIDFEEILPHFSTIKLVSVVDAIQIVPSGYEFDPDNVFNCREVICSEHEEDLAIFKVRNTRDIMGIPYIPYEKVSSDPVEMGAMVYTIGYPFSLQIQDYEKKPLQPYFSAGEVSNTVSDYSFGLTAASYHGASGSPVFDSYGNLVGILEAGISESQGFNYAIKSIYLYNLLKKANLIK